MDVHKFMIQKKKTWNDLTSYHCISLEELGIELQLPHLKFKVRLRQQAFCYSKSPYAHFLNSLALHQQVKMYQVFEFSKRPVVVQHFKEDKKGGKKKKKKRQRQRKSFVSPGLQFRHLWLRVQSDYFFFVLARRDKSTISLKAPCIPTEFLQI